MLLFIAMAVLAVSLLAALAVWILAARPEHCPSFRCDGTVRRTVKGWVCDKCARRVE